MSELVKLNLVGIDGNAFSILGAFRQAAREQGADSDWVDNVIEEAKSGDYHHLIATILDNTVSDDFDLDDEYDEWYDEYDLDDDY